MTHLRLRGNPYLGGLDKIHCAFCRKRPGLNRRTFRTDDACFAFTFPDSSTAQQQNGAYEVLVETGWSEERDTRMKKQNGRKRKPKRKHVVPLFHNSNVTCMKVFLFPYSSHIFLFFLSVYVFLLAILRLSLSYAPESFLCPSHFLFKLLERQSQGCPSLPGFT